MKNVFLMLVLAVTLYSCDENIPTIGEPVDPIEATILGRWVLDGFESNIRYEFTENKRYTIYGLEGLFPTLEEFVEQNPGLHGHDWEYDGSTIVVDLNFGNFSRLVPNFTCGNYVVNFTSEDGSEHSTFYREGHDIDACN